MRAIQHKKARLDYEILKEFEAGLELFGYEVKSLRARRGKLEGAHIVVRPSGKRGHLEAYLVGANIPPYQAANTPESYEPERSRRLLLNKAEIARLNPKLNPSTTMEINCEHGHGYGQHRQ